ncbi:MAG: hypothetical protein K2Q25_13810 [Mycobacteriaceae bacterium]|nr:hypothetical protein [Mycobacteriaceae bacterium]
MTTEQDRDLGQIRAEMDTLLAELPDLAATGSELTLPELEALACRLSAAHDVLVRALESAEKG